MFRAPQGVEEEEPRERETSNVVQALTLGEPDSRLYMLEKHLELLKVEYPTSHSTY